MRPNNGLALLLILGALCTISPFSIDMYLPAFPQVAAALRADVARVSLTLSSYFIGLSLGQIFYGPFLDRFGRKPPLYAGLLLYILASVACIFASNLDQLIVFRLFQALGGCAAQIACMAMVRDFYPPEKRAQVFSKLMLILSVSPLFAPTVGGLIVAAWSWTAVFVFLAVIVSLILAVVFFFLPEGHEADPGISLNPWAIAQDYGAIFKNAQFLVYAFGGAFSFAGLFSYLGASSAIFMNTYQLSVKQFSLLFAVLSVGLIGGGQVNIALLRRFSGEYLFKNALFAQVLLAFIFLVGALTGTCGLVGHIVIFFLYLSCVGLTYPNAATLALLPFDRNAGSAAAMLGFSQMGIGALASAGFGYLHFSASVSLSIIFTGTALTGTALYLLRPKAAVSAA